MPDLKQLKFDKDGLIPAIVVDYRTKQTLTLAYMNRESLEITLTEKRTCFYSRSRKELWRKGATSGNYQNVVSVTADCDCDAIVIEVDKAGPACHTGAESCFHNPIFSHDGYKQFSYQALYEMIKGRKIEKKEGSYTTYLFKKGLDKILKKVGEECTEVIIAAKGGDRRETIYEIADLAYHVMVLMVQENISLDEIYDELSSRHVVDKKIKQETMK